MTHQINTLRRSTSFNPFETAVADSTKQGSIPVLTRAVVIDMILDVSNLSNEFRIQLEKQVVNAPMIDLAPPGSVIAKIVSNSGGNLVSNLHILFPLFSSHIMMPVNPGEMIFAIFEDGGITGNSATGYWIDRIHGAKIAEDPNYTHVDRLLDPTNNLQNYDAAMLQQIGTKPRFGDAIFNNGAEHTGVYTLNQEQNGKNPYNIYFSSSRLRPMITIEPVPRYNKRPQELIIQGTNNALLMIGEDRRGSILGASVPDQNNKTDRKNSGTFDMVVGRGRTPATAPLVVTNERALFESSKTPFKYKKDVNPKEGDPDFISDASRLYISSNTEGDTNFHLDQVRYPASVFPIVQPDLMPGRPIQTVNLDKLDNPFVFTSPPSNNAFAILKSDHIRIIGRQSEEPGVAANGSVLMIHEGKASVDETLEKSKGRTETQDLGLAMLLLNEEGAHLHGKFVHLGPARDHTEPMVLWSTYVDTVTNLQEQIQKLTKEHGEQMISIYSTLKMLTVTLSQIFASTNTCPPGGPNPALTAASAAMVSIMSQLDSSLISNVTNTSSDIAEKQIDNLQNNLDATNHSKIVFVS